MRDNIGTGNRIRRLGSFTFLVGLLIVLMTSPQTAVAFQVPPLPEGNLVVNPWFRSTGQPNEAGLDHWTDAAGPGVHWSGSQKVSNPTPDDITSSMCGDRPFCGTAARFGKPKGGNGPDHANEDAYLYQVIPADSSRRRLVFFTHWITDHLAEATITVYGSDSQDGSWVEVWVPLNAPLGEGSSRDWVQTEWLETTIESGYAFYKIEFYTRFLPDGSGAKFTGVYFAVTDAEDKNPPVPTPVPTLPAVTGTPEINDTPTATAASVIHATSESVITATVQAEVLEIASLTATAVSPTQIDLNWSMDSDDLRGYKIERSLDGSTDWDEIAKVGVEGDTYSDEGLDPETAYFYRVRISLLNGDSYYLEVVSAMTEPVPTPTPTIEQSTATATIEQPSATAVPSNTPSPGLPDEGEEPAPGSLLATWLFLTIAGIGVILTTIWLVVRARRV